MDAIETVRRLVIRSLKALESEGKIPSELAFDKIGVEILYDSERGDITTNAALVLSREAGMSSLDLAALLREKLIEPSNALHSERVD